ncbi:MAG: ATP-binding protein [Marinifilaceae bacterium]
MKIAIASGKGGTGKTTLSTNLASYLAEKQEVVLADLDVEEPNSSFFLNTELVCSEDKFIMTPKWDSQKCNACGECRTNCNFNAIVSLGKEIMLFPELCHSCYACSDLCSQNALPMIPRKMGRLTHSSLGNLSFVEGRLDIGQVQAVSLISQTISYLDENFSKDTIIILDSPPGTSCPVMEVAKNVDYIILISEPTPFGMSDLKLAARTMQLLNKDFGLVINRYENDSEEILELCKEENIEIIAKIPNDRKIAELYSKGKLIYTEHDAFREQLDVIYNKILYKKGVCR